MKRSWLSRNHKFVDNRFVGGHVPVSESTTNGRILRRKWNGRHKQWCSLCKEPIDSWGPHMGRRDHQLLDAAYTSHTEYPRAWDPDAVIHGAVNRLGCDYYGFYRYYDAQEHMRRDELFSMLRTVTKDKLVFMAIEELHSQIYISDAKSTFYEHSLRSIFHLFPESSVDKLSACHQYVMNSYNLERVYELLSIFRLDPHRGRNYKFAADGAEGLWDSEEGVTLEDRQGDMESAERVPEFSHRSMVVKGLLGQLRWCLDADSVPGVSDDDAYLVMIGEILCRGLLAEAVTIRTAEYGLLAEAVWEEFGKQRRPPLQLHNSSATPNLPSGPLAVFCSFQ